MQKQSWLMTKDEMREQHEETLLNEIRKRENKAQMYITLFAGSITLNLLLLMVILFIR